MKTFMKVLAISVIAVLFMADDDCNPPQPHSDSGVAKASVSIPIGSDGLTTEQRNVRSRLLEDNKPGSIKHLYVISPYSGQVILYSTVKGKVTSSGKRLTPTSVAVTSGQYNATRGFDFHGAQTGEVLQDDGTYGASGDYLYWWDVRGAYHQHYLTGGQIITVSDQPLPVKSVTINIENVAGEK